MKKRIFILLLLISYQSFAQLTYEKQVEFKVKEGYDFVSISQLGESGLMMRSINKSYSDDQYEWLYEKLNTDLEKVGERSVLMDKSYYSDSYVFSGQSMYTLFKNKEGDFTIIKVNTNDLSYSQTPKSKMPKKINVTQMVISGNYAYLKAQKRGGKFILTSDLAKRQQKKEKFILSVNLETGKQNLIPLKWGNHLSQDLYIHSLQVVRGTNEVFLPIRIKVTKKTNQMYVMRFNQGERKNLISLTSVEDKNIMSVSVSAVNEGKYIFSGTYGAKKGKTKGKTEGLFFCVANQLNNIESFSLHKFTELDGFFSFLPDKEDSWMNKRVHKLRKKGKEYDILYQVTTHPSRSVGNEYLLLAEAFYPTYRTESSLATEYVDGKAKYVTNRRAVFDGYEYTHAVLAHFTQDGKIKWSTNFKMQPQKPKSIRKFIAIKNQSENSLELLFLL